MKLYVDEDLSPQLVRVCHERGYDATCARDRGMLSAKDRFHVAPLLYDEERVIVTEDWDDFDELFVEQGIHYGLVAMPSRRLPVQEFMMDFALKLHRGRSRTCRRDPGELHDQLPRAGQRGRRVRQPRLSLSLAERLSLETVHRAAREDNVDRTLQDWLDQEPYGLLRTVPLSSRTRAGVQMNHLTHRGLAGPCRHFPQRCGLP